MILKRMSPLLLIFLLAFIDIITKELMRQSVGEIQFLGIDLLAKPNSGIIFGWGSSISPIAQIFLATILISIFFALYFIYLSLFQINKTSIHLGLVMVLAGVLGNYIDRIIYQEVLDFIHLKLYSLSLLFNIADIFLFFGILLITFHLLKPSVVKSIWKDKRTRVFIFPSAQRKLAVIFMIINTTSSGLIILISYYLLKLYLPQSISFQFLTYALFFIITLNTIFYFVGIIIGKHFFGPLYALIEYQRRNQKDEQPSFKLRERDEFKILEEVFSNESKK
ncbi:MAG: hypothetical protein CME62_13715 [Halobacteriovoraceae bacterium]|nr:hypothetical protein [Halobacteriovoraceae bacterium]|tara:strand:+ start:9031 stop:9867 length:837 start_codon:yes stop_codon:yes gene_type:complete